MFPLVGSILQTVDPKIEVNQRSPFLSMVNPSGFPSNLLPYSKITFSLPKKKEKDKKISMKEVVQ